MIKIEHNVKCKAYWKDGCEHETYRIQERKIKIFGLTIYKTSYGYDCDITDDKTNGFGFKKS